jgi:acylphosphatase
MRLHVAVHGHVQGVGFRWFVRQRARALGVAGWVCNRPDGSVEVSAEGSGHALLELRQAIATGPSGAIVQRIVELETGGEPLETPFMIVR